MPLQKEDDEAYTEDEAQITLLRSQTTPLQQLARSLLTKALDDAFCLSAYSCAMMQGRMYQEHSAIALPVWLTQDDVILKERVN